MKPDAPDGIRGEFKPIKTAVPGISMCEHLPELAARADELAIVRSLAHGYTNHLNATHEILTGHSQPGAFFDKIASRDDYPCYAAAIDAIRPRGDGVPSGVMLPTFLMEGPLVWPGQHAGFLGPKHDPWQVRQDPNRPGFGFEGLALPDGLSRRTAGPAEVAAGPGRAAGRSDHGGRASSGKTRSPSRSSGPTRCCSRARSPARST